MKLHTDSTTSIFLSGTIGYANSQKLTSSTGQKITQKYNDTKLLSNSIHENNTAPIRLSVIVLVCLSAIIIMLYLALYARDHTNDIKKLVFRIGKQTVELIVPEMLIVMFKKRISVFIKY